MTPTLVFLDHCGLEVRREVRSIEPSQLVQVAKLAQGQAHGLHGELGSAMAFLDEVGARGLPTLQPKSCIGLVWFAAAGKPRGRLGLLDVLEQRYFDGTWGRRISFIERSEWRECRRLAVSPLGRQGALGTGSQWLRRER